MFAFNRQSQKLSINKIFLRFSYINRIFVIANNVGNYFCMFAEKRDVNSAHNQIVSVSIVNLDVVALSHLGKKPCGK